MDKKKTDWIARARAASSRSRRQLEADTGSGGIAPFPQWLTHVSPRLTWDFPHQQLLYTFLNRIDTGQSRRLMLFVPPRHFKSHTVSIRYPVWRLEKDPASRVILAANSQKLANRFSRAALRLAKGRVELAPDRKAVEEWETTQDGGLRAVGIGGAIHGYGANLFVIDDPVGKRDLAESESFREMCWDWYGTDVVSRLEPSAAIILIMTRFHSDDLAGRLLLANDCESESEPWEVLRLPALAEDDDPLGRQPGQALCPARFDEKALARIRAEMGEYQFAAIYQQRPLPAGGGMFKREWFNFSVVPPDQVPAGLEWVRYYDLAASIKKTGHFTATAACALDTNGDLYIRDVWRVREEWPDIRRRMIETMRAEPGVVHGVELKAYGLAAVQDLMREPKIAHIALVGVDIAPGQSKIVRAMAWSPRAEAGKVKLVRGPWITSFLNEICAFPHGSHDDQADMVSGCVQMIGSGIGMAVSHGPTLDQLFSRGMS